jgi:hypothetical protein
LNEAACLREAENKLELGTNVPAGAEAWRLSGPGGTTEQLGEKVEYRGRVFENIPQVLKPGVDSIAFAARLKSCPFKTSASGEFFTKL